MPYDTGTAQLLNQLTNPPNPMDYLQKATNALTSMRDFQSNQAAAQAYQQSVDPDTGQFDINKFNAIASQLPGGSWRFGQQMLQSGQGQQAQGQGTTAQTDAARAQLGLLSGYMTPLLQAANNGQPVTPDQVKSVLDNAIGLTPQMKQAVLTKLGTLQPGQNANGLLIGWQFATQSGEGQATRLYPTVGQNVDISKWLTEQTQWPDPNDPTKIHYGTNGDRLRELGIDPTKLLGGAASGGYGPGAGVGGKPSSGGASSAVLGKYGAIIQAAAEKYKVDPDLIASVIQTESNGDPKSFNKDTQAAGLGNITPDTAKHLGITDVYDPGQNINGVAAYLREGMDKYNGDTTQALKYYYGGPDESKWGPKTEAYPGLVMGKMPKAGAPQPSDAGIQKLFQLGSMPGTGNFVPGAPAVTQSPTSGPGYPVQLASAAPVAGPTLVAGGGAQLSPNVQPADFPTGRVGTMPVTLPETSKASGQQYVADLGTYNQLPARLSPLTQAAGILKANPTLGTGTGAEDIQKLASLAQNFGFTLSPAANNNLTAFTELNKDLERYYLGLPGGQRSDLAQAETKMSQPSTQMQREALEDLVARTIGLERANSAPVVNFMQQHGQANAANYAPQYQAESAAYRNTLDPVAFGFDQMTTQQRKAYLDSLTTDDARQRYLFSIKEASRLYGIPLPR
jgi:hypothetical protein